MANIDNLDIATKKRDRCAFCRQKLHWYNGKIKIGAHMYHKKCAKCRKCESVGNYRLHGWQYCHEHAPRCQGMEKKLFFKQSCLLHSFNYVTFKFGAFSNLKSIIDLSIEVRSLTMIFRVRQNRIPDSYVFRMQTDFGRTRL